MHWTESSGAWAQIPANCGASSSLTRSREGIKATSNGISRDVQASTAVNTPAYEHGNITLLGSNLLALIIKI